ncbi:MAG: endonuclease III [Actinomycetota bacterium]
MHEVRVACEGRHLLTELPSVRRIRAVNNRLRKSQGEFVPKTKLPIIDELILTVLSQNTSDVNRDRAYAGLRERFPTWEQVRRAQSSHIAAAIRPGGIAEVKSRRIKAILQSIYDSEGSLDLRRVRSLSDAEAVDYLCALPGVGPKTAACVLVFSMGRPAFPVDTHVHRVVRRLGWVPEKASAEMTHQLLGPRVPPEIRYELHIHLIEHGRTICKANMPLCSRCPLLDVCVAGPKFLATGRGR